MIAMGFREDVVKVAIKKADWSDASEDEQITYILTVEGICAAGFSAGKAVAALEKHGGFTPEELKLCTELIQMGFDASEVGNAVKACEKSMGKALDLLGDVTY